jgi:radical SAM protein with 4Fe4S-binding SPASM domain
MTVAQDNPEISKNIRDILKINLFDSIHWQLDAGFYKNDFIEKNTLEFFKKYNISITELVQFWINEIKKGKVIKLYPFIGIASRLLGIDKEIKMMCGAGHSGYAITTSGRVVACPIMNNIKDFECGSLDTIPNNLKKIQVISPCTTCNEYAFCGGRCLYSNHAKLWGSKGEKAICNATKHLIREIRNYLPEIELAIKQRKISIKDFRYEKYFGPEIIP